eukprot:354993-Chlamydomonas_euryale.AAC.1
MAAACCGLHGDDGGSRLRLLVANASRKKRLLLHASGRCRWVVPPLFTTGLSCSALRMDASSCEVLPEDPTRCQ